MRHIRHRRLTVSSLGLLLIALFAYQSRADILLDPLRDFLVQTVTKIISKSLNGTLEVGALRGSLLSAPTLHEVVLRDAEGNTVGQIDEIRLAYDLKTLLKKRLTVRQVEIIRPQIRLVQEANGRLNLDRLFRATPSEAPAEPPEESGGGLPFALVIENAHIRDGQLTLGFPSLPGVRTLEGLQVHLQGQIDHQGLRGMVHQFTVQAKPAAVDIRTLRGGFQALAAGVQLDNVRLQTANTLVTANGALPGRRQVASLDIQIQPLDVTEVGRLLGNDTLHGLLRLALHAEGPADALAVQSQIHLGDGQIRLQGQVNTVATPLRYTASLAVQKFDLSAAIAQAALQSNVNLHLQAEGEGVTWRDLRGQVRLEIQPSHVGDIVLRPSLLHLEAQSQRFEIQQCRLDTSLARMTATGRLDLAGRSAVQYQVAADLSQLQQLLGIETLGGDVAVRGQVEGEQTALRTHGTVQANRLQYQTHRMQTLQVTYDGRDLGPQLQATAHLVAQAARLDTLPVEQLELQATYQGEPRQMQFSTTVRQSATDGGSLRGIVTLGREAQQIVLEHMEIRLAERLWRATSPPAVTIVGDRVSLQPFRLAHAEESVEVSGSLAGRHFQDVRLHVQSLNLQALRRLLPVPELLGQRASVQMALTGAVAAPRLQGEVWLEPKAVPGAPAQRLHTTVRYEDKQFQSAVRLGQAEREVLSVHVQLPIDLALTPLSVPQRLSEAPLAVRVNINGLNLAALRHWMTVLPEFAGSVQGQVIVQGRWHALEVDTSLQAQRLSMPGVIEDLNTALRLRASVAAAPTLPALGQALAQGEAALQVQKLEVRASTVRAQLPAQEGAPQPLLIDNLLLQADGRVNRAGLQATLRHLRLQAVAFGLPRTDLTVAGRMTPQQVEVTHLEARLPLSEVRVRGTLQHDGQRLRATVELPRLRLDELVRQLPSDLPPEVQGTITIEGSIPAPQVNARLQYAAAQIVADVKAQLHEALPQYNASLTVDGLPIASLLPGTPGVFQVQAQVRGAGFAGPQRRAALELTVASPNFALAPRLDTRVRASVEGDAVQLTQLQVRSVPVALDARGTLSATQQVDLTYTVTLGDLQALRNVLGVAMQAQGRLTGEASGRLEALETRGTLQLDSWTVADFQGKNMRLAYTATHLPTAPRATLTARLSELQGPSLPGSGLDVQGTYEAQQGTFSLAMTRGPYAHTVLAGQVALQDGLRLTLERLRLQRQTLAWENAAPVEIVRDAQGTLRLPQLLLRSGGQEISARATLRPEGTVDGTVQVQRVPIWSTVQAFAPGASVPDGQLAVDLTVSGPLKQPAIDGTVAVTALHWQEQPLGDIQAQITAVGETFRTDVRWQDQGQDLLHIFGTVETGAKVALALQVQMADVDMARLKSLSPAVVQSAGTLQVDLRLTGTPPRPVVQGTIRLRDGALLLAATGERYKNINTSLVFLGDRVEIQRLEIGSRSGVMQINGWATSAGLTLQQVEVSMSAENFTAMHTPDIEAMLTGNLVLRGSLDELEAIGKLTVPRARVRLSGKLGGGLADVEAWELTVDGVYGPGPGVLIEADGRTTIVRQRLPLPFLRADLTVEIPRNTWVQGTGTAIEMRGQMRVTKALEQPFILDGTVETIRGFASFYGKKFVVQEGRVVFPGTEEINPFLDVLVTHAVAGYIVSIQVGGKAKQPHLALSSTPELLQADIVALLLVGKTTDRLTSAEQSSLASQAQQVVGGAAAGELEKVLGKPLGLDTVEVEAGKEIGTGSVSVGRYVTQDIFLSYERAFGGEQSNTVGVEYSINRRLKLKGSGSDSGESAVDLLWRHDY